MSGPMSGLVARDLWVDLGGAPVLRGVDLHVGPDETVAVLGPSGSGKSTLLRTIAGLVPVSRGALEWNGASLAAVPAHTRRIGLLFQDHALFPHLDVAGNVEFGLRMHKVAAAPRAARVAELLALVGMPGFGPRAVSTLSGGERQRVALARALAADPHLLLLDEPFASLDRPRRDELLGEVQAIVAAARIPAVVVTHDHDEAFALARRVVLLHEGRVEQSGAPDEVWRAPASEWAARFVGYDALGRGAATGGVVRFAWGAVPVAEGVVGEGVVVARPGALCAGPPEAVQPEAPAGVLQRVQFRAGRTEGWVAIDGGPVVRAQVDPGVVPGTRVEVSVEPGGVLLYPDA